MERLQEELVEQVVDAGRRARFRKEIWQADGEHPLGLVRKTLPDGPTRPPVVLVHGFAQNRYTWHTSQRSLVNWLALKGWDVWNLELRGHGRSRTTRAQGAEVFADYVDDVVHLAEHFDGRAFLVGHSLGGAACYGAATRAPVAGVVGIGAIFGFASANWMMRLVTGTSHAMRDRILADRATVRIELAGKILARLYGLTDTLGYWFPLSGWWPGSIEPDLLEERLVNGFDWTSVKVWLEMSRWAVEGRFDYQDEWATTDVPLLVMAGDEDHLAAPADARLAYDKSGSSDRSLVIFDHFEHEVHWGHLDLVLGRKAPEHTWPCLESWMAERAGPALAADRKTG